MEIIRAKADFYHPFGAAKEKLELKPGEDIVTYVQRKYPHMNLGDALSKIFNDVFKFKKGELYVLARDLRDALPKQFIEQAKVKKFPKFYNGFDDLNGKTIIFFNLHAYGDSLIATPIYKHLKEKYPKSKIIVEIKKNYNILKGNPYIDDFVYTPVHYDSKIMNADYFVDFYEMVNSYPYNNLNLVDFWAMQLKLQLKDKLPVLHQPKNIYKWKNILDEIRKETGKPIMVLHGIASSLHRTVPMVKLIELMNKFKDEYAFVTIYPAYQQDEINNFKAELLQFDNYFNLSKHSGSIQDLLAAIYNLTDDDIVISADTVVPHICAAYKKHCYVLAGGIAPEAQHYFKSSYEPYVRIIYNTYFIGQVCKNNCLIHAHAGPCPEAQQVKQTYSPCLLTLDVNNVYNIIKNYQNVHKTTCINCNAELDWHQVDEKGIIYYCDNCKIRFREDRIKDFIIPKPNFQFKDDDFEANIITNFKHMMQYASTLPFIRDAKTISIIQEYPGNVYYTLKHINPNIKFYELHENKIQYDEKVLFDINFIKDYKEIQDNNDLLIVDVYAFAFAQEEPDAIIYKLLNKLNENGVLLLTYVNANRYYVHAQRNIDISLFFTRMFGNYELSYNYIRDKVKEIDKDAYNKIKMHLESYIKNFNELKIKDALKEVISIAIDGDAYLSNKEPWKIKDEN